MSTQSYLDASVYANDVYNTTFVPVINAWTQPKAPGVFEGKPQYYDMATNTVYDLNPAEFTPDKLSASSGACGTNQPHGGPFRMPVTVGGKMQCMDTNNAPASSWYPDQVLNTQQIPVRPNAINAGGGVCGTCVGYGPSSNWRR